MEESIEKRLAKARRKIGMMPMTGIPLSPMMAWYVIVYLQTTGGHPVSEVHGQLQSFAIGVGRYLESSVDWPEEVKVDLEQGWEDDTTDVTGD